MLQPRTMQITQQQCERTKIQVVHRSQMLRDTSQGPCFFGKPHPTTRAAFKRSRFCSWRYYELGQTPVRVEMHGALTQFLNSIEGAGAEERHSRSVWYYDRNSFLHRIVVPSSNKRIPAKVFAWTGFPAVEPAIFGRRLTSKRMHPNQWTESRTLLGANFG